VTRPDENCETSPCPACRGRGYKLRSSRHTLLIGTGGEEAEAMGERTCLDCLASGQAGGNGK
jgi:hypothetical protein